jgi:hypothetical protein
VADEARIQLRREMRARDDGIERQHEFRAGPRRNDCGVVTDTDADVVACRAAPHEMTVDQLELAGRHRPVSQATWPRSTARCACEALSSTALTKRCPSVAP